MEVSNNILQNRILNLTMSTRDQNFNAIKATLTQAS